MKTIETKHVDKCPLCKSDKNKRVFNNFDRLHNLPGTFRVAQCIACRSLYLMDVPKDLKSYYPEGAYYSTCESNSNKLSFKKKLIKLYFSGERKMNLSYFVYYLVGKRIQGIPKYIFNGKVLDVGCGSGLLLDLLKDSGWQTFGVDVSKRAINLLIEKGHNGICSELKSNLYPSDYFDAILISHAIEHVSNPKEYLKIIYDKLKKNGQLILLAPNANSLGYKLFKRAWAPIETPRHLFVPTPKIIRETLIDTGFKVESIKYTGGNWAQSLNYVLNKKFTPSSFLYNRFVVLGLEALAQILNLARSGDSFQINAKK